MSAKKPSFGSPCRNGDGCRQKNCRFEHPSRPSTSSSALPGRATSSIGEVDQVREDLNSLKPFPMCSYAAQCANFRCKHQHPASRKPPCPDGKECSDTDCRLAHPPGKNFDRSVDLRKCKSYLSCANPDCTFVHGEGRIPICPLGIDCEDYECKLSHMPSRKKLCKEASDCPNPWCQCLHPDSWVPPAKVKRSRRQVASSQSSISSPNPNKKTTPVARQVKNPTTKSLADRAKLRSETRLPILEKRQEFMERLQKDRIMIVTAATGSGKTTQLPQYAAEMLKGIPGTNGLVVCTQPRAIAALSISERIANEYDGTSCGNNVGHKTGSAKSVEGDEIMLVTDSALVRWNQKAPLLEDISVLIIDEAHERSLYTDLVLGIAKQTLKKRRNDFFVVVASATIDPAAFIDFFRSAPHSIPYHLDCRGKVFPIEVFAPERGGLFDPDEGDEDMMKRLPSIVLKAATQIPQGNILVFVPGSSEADKACAKFSALSSSQKHQNIEWVPKVLYGTLPATHQQECVTFDDRNGLRRMILFCTNVAETSLTIPNVRLVIDTGLAKEARFDPKRRVQVLELVQISKSSSTQRKGRAGRTAPGTYIPLFVPDSLERDNIMPEITRSSLDLVTLDLCILGKDPLSFDWMTAPESSAVDAAIQTLKSLNCIVSTPNTGMQSSRLAATPLGKSFAQMRFDPRISYFVYECARQGELVIATEVASIISASGQIDFLGDKSPEQRQEIANHHQEQVQQFDSDLLYQVSRLNKWQDSGRISDESKTCPRCSKKLRFGYNGCGPCRVKYAVNNHMNNKSLESIDLMVKKVLQFFRSDKELSSVLGGLPVPSPQQYAKDPPRATAMRAGGKYRTPELTRILAQGLLHAFPEQVCQLISAKHPEVGIFVMDVGMKAKVAAESFWTQKIAKNARKLTHPLELDWMTESQSMRMETNSIELTEFINRPNLNPWFCTHLQNHLFKQLKDGNKIASWVFLSHHKGTLRAFVPSKPSLLKDESGAKISALSLNNLQLSIKSTLDNLINKQISSERDVPIDETHLVTFSSGLKISKLTRNEDSKTLRVDCSKAFEHNYADFIGLDSQCITWIAAQARIQRSDIQWCSVTSRGDSTIATISVASPIAARIQNLVPVVDRSDHGKTIILRSILNNEDLIKQILHLNSAPFTSFKPDPVYPSFGIKKLPSHLTTQPVLKNLLENGQDNLIHSVNIGNSKGGFYANITLKSEEAYQTVLKTAQSHSLTVCSYPDQHSPQMTMLYRICFKSPPSPHLLSSLSSIASPPIEFENNIKVPRFNLYATQLNHLSSQYKSKTCRIRIVPPKNGAKVRHQGHIFISSSDQTALQTITNQFEQAILPLEFRIKTREMTLLFEEIMSSECSGSMREAVKNVHIEMMPNRSVSVYGSKIDLGIFMATYASYSSILPVDEEPDLARFPPRFESIPISSAIFSAIDGPRSPHYKSFSKICKSCTPAKVTLNRRHLTIEVLVPPKHMNIAVRTISQAKMQIKKFLALLGEPVHTEQDCVFCKLAPLPGTSRRFNICGHSYCLSCLDGYLKNCKDDKICCPKCDTVVAITDIMALFELDMASLKSTVVRRLEPKLSILSQNTLSMCKYSDCGAIMRVSDGYTKCGKCLMHSCPACGEIEKPLHQGRNCSQYQQEVKRVKELEKELKRQALERAMAPKPIVDWNELFTRAETFARANWPHIQPLNPMIHIQRNTYLLNGHSSAKMYEKAVELLGGAAAIQNGFFAWHGTPTAEAVLAIFSQGFDTKRRNGQAYGPGEYFGQTAEVSHGYAHQSGRMLVCHLLTSQYTSTHSNFCYVVNNPTDFSMHYCVPLLVISYGPTKDPLKLPPVPSISVMPARNNPIHELQPEEILMTDVEIQEVRPFRWLWGHDDGGFRMYNQAVSDWIELTYERHKYNQSNGSGQYLIPEEITRLVDDKKGSYLVDFVKMQQINNSTKYKRRLDRQRVEIPISNAKWYYQSEHQTWLPFDPTDVAKLESVFSNYIAGGSAQYDLCPVGRPETYTINMVTWNQTNKVSGVVRKVWRN